MEFAEEIAKEADQYNGFNLLLADILSATMVYVTNRLKGDGCYITAVPPGVHVLSNASLDTPWPKVTKLSPLLVICSLCFKSAPRQGHGRFRETII